MKAEETSGVQIDAKKYLPCALLQHNGNLCCEWITLDGGRFTEPFFDDTLRLLKFLPLNETPTISSTREIIKAAEDLGPVKPAMIIFHISRCGSTLVSQAFATSERFTVLAEVPVFDDILRAPFRGLQIDTTGLFDAALRLYGQKRWPKEEHVLIKTDCWHIFFYETLRQWFPQTPFVLLYRSPAEVLRSLLKKPSIQIVPEIIEPEVFGLPGFPDPYNVAAYASTVLEKTLEKFITVAKADENTLLVNYSEGPGNLVEKIAAFAGSQLDDEERRVIADRMRFNAKTPEDLFLTEPPAEVPECLEPAMAVYERLEEVRMARNY